ncbi:MAG TPA: hypothetical protein VF912_12080, partial [Anaeromyxobacter sp.]
MSLPFDSASVPWPSLVVRGPGAVLPSSAAIELLGFSPGNVQELERRIVILTAQGEPIVDGAQP